MANRITNKHLETLANRLNVMTNSPTAYWDDGKCNVGHFHISYAYSGACLVRTVNDGGGVTCPIGSGHVSKRECYEQMYAFIRGIEFAKEQQS